MLTAAVYVVMADLRHPNTSIITAKADHLITIMTQAVNKLIIQWIDFPVFFLVLK